MNNSSEDQNVVKDAIRIAHVFNKHLFENCPHCQKLLEEIFRNEN
jgi:hypothetical protein